MDIKVETDRQELIDVEIQVFTADLFRNRAVYYGARLTADGLAEGEDYDKMKQSIVISIRDQHIR